MTRASDEPGALLHARGASRGGRTRSRIVAAARVVFERDGYVDARLTDITAEAGCAIGSFYTHFNDKAAVLQAVLDLVRDENAGPPIGELFRAGVEPHV